MAGIKLTHIPYKGSGPVLNDLIGGHIPMSFTPIPAAHGQVESGTLKALAVTSLKRSALLPAVPTVAESGLPGYEAVLHYGLLAPKGTPRPIIDRLNKELRAALSADDIRKRMVERRESGRHQTGMRFTPVARRGGPRPFQRFVRKPNPPSSQCRRDN
jgi:tripartite-type tricarboxylate transporter receptor subunit TctC